MNLFNIAWVVVLFLLILKLFGVMIGWFIVFFPVILIGGLIAFLVVSLTTYDHYKLKNMGEKTKWGKRIKNTTKH
jgi:membrane-bound ClpP family serine protease